MCIDCILFPKRLPDLNPLDYGYWSRINKLMRQQEAKLASDKRETRKAFLARLRRTIKRTPAKVLTPLVKSMHHRCKALKQAGGMHFEE